MPTHEDLDHQQHLLSIYRRNLKILLTQAAHFGGEDDAPLHIINGIREARDNIQRVKGILRDWKVNVADDVSDRPGSLL
jgi:hypothetical protein